MVSQLNNYGTFVFLQSILTSHKGSEPDREGLGSSIADPESGSFLTPGSRMGKKSGSGMNNPDHISEPRKDFF
jgi:hypothetical protein